MTESDTDECPNCGGEFDTENGQLFSDFEFHMMRCGGATER